MTSHGSIAGWLIFGAIFVYPLWLWHAGEAGACDALRFTTGLGYPLNGPENMRELKGAETKRRLSLIVAVTASLLWLAGFLCAA